MDNCPDLAAILALKDDFDPSIAEFAKTYAGRTIEFDGNIASMANHGSDTTRYDFLVYAGDYNENSVSGPDFQFSDVNYGDLHTDIESVTAGINVHIVATVGSYSSSSGLFQLKPVSVTAR